MKKLLKTTIIKSFGFLKGGFCGALVSAAPTALIHHKDLSQYFSHLNYSVIIFFSISICLGSILCFLLPSFPTKRAILVTIYLFFYTACAVLCQRLGLTSLVLDPQQYETNHISTLNCPLTVIPGTALICITAIRFITIIVKNYKNAHLINKESKYSAYLNWLLFMAAIPLIFSVWLPLLALPGAYVLILWLV